MTTRDQLYHQFGPLLHEAQDLTILSQLNVIRAHLGLPQLTEQQMLDKLQEELDSLEPYAWLNEQL